MKKYIFLILSFIILFPVACRKGKPEEYKKNLSYNLEEKLDSIPLVIVMDKKIDILNLKTLKSFGTYPLNIKDLVKSFMLENRLFIVCKEEVHWMVLGEKKFKSIPLSFKAKAASVVQNNIILYNEHSIFQLHRNGEITKLADLKRKLQSIQPFPDFSSLLLFFQEEGTYELSKFSLLSKKSEETVKIEEPIKIELSHFAKRIYLLTKEKLIFLDAKDLTPIAEIPIGALCKDLIITPSENKVFIFTEEPPKIVAVERAILKIVGEVELGKTPEKKGVTGDGSTVFFVSDDTLYRFDTGINKVVKKGSLEKGTDIVETTKIGSEVFLGRRGEPSLEIMDGNTLLPLEKMKLAAGLVDILCSTTVVRKESEDTVSVTIPKKDTASHLTKKFEKPGKKYYTLQVSSSSIAEGALKLYNRIKSLSLPVYIDSSEYKDGQKIYKVKIGAFLSRKDAENFKEGIRETHNLTAWVSENVLEPSIMKKVGVDINGDKNGEILLFNKSTVSLFTNYNGLQKPVFSRNIEGITFRGKPIVVKEANNSLLGLPFDGDSLLIIRWTGKVYETEKRPKK